jgi:hypothetical protein
MIEKEAADEIRLELVKDLIGVFERHAHLDKYFGWNDRALGVQSCIDHLRDYSLCLIPEGS